MTPFDTESHSPRHLAAPASPALASPAPSLPPALLRRLRGVRTVKALRSPVGVLTAGLLAAASIALVLPTTTGSEALVASVPEPPAQSLSIAAASPLAALARDSYSAVAPPKLQYPLPPGSAVASGYGPRECSNCYSNFHHGIDIFPGAGTPIAAMANGVVSKANAAGDNAMGVNVHIDHVIDGVPVTSVYGHLQAGSLGLRVGDTVTVGQLIGRVGATGNAAGAHLHFEIHPGGSGSVNPYAWLAARIG
ncbi:MULTISPECIES: M23 family metallopeptidase [unclassified Salinibacterium]|uniref:M23 family metallopeptidase n=1 Tax=unclassified Salinibacterium TaxID=2632331 RepID=UPI00143DD51C|nr:MULTISPECIES: M23 family metallopeptidase [unclassified Salinibacterium]